jgi:hypothetical protein
LTVVSDEKRFWKLIFELILSADTAHYFDFLNELTDLSRSGTWNSTEGGRQLVMALLVKCSEMWPMVKSVGIAQSLYDIVSNDFFEKGDFGQVEGLRFYGSSAKRECVDRQNSKSSFLKGICRPAFQNLCDLFPKLKYLLEQLDSNISSLCK